MNGASWPIFPSRTIKIKKCYRYKLPKIILIERPYVHISEGKFMHSSAYTINHLLSVNRLTHNTEKKFYSQKKAIKNRIKTFSFFVISWIHNFILGQYNFLYCRFFLWMEHTCVCLYPILPYDLLSTTIIGSVASKY